MGFAMSTETDILGKVGEYFQNRGWEVRKEVKVRGRVADIVAIKDEKMAAVEVKGTGGDVQKGIMQALHHKGAVNFSYLTIHRQNLTNSVESTCKNLGIGLLVVDDRVEEVGAPEFSEALSSVRKHILKKNQKTRKKKTLDAKSHLDAIFRSKTLILVLKLLFLSPSKEFHLSDVARKTGVTKPAVSKELSKLVRTGLVTRREQDNISFYKINKDAVIFEEMRRIFLKYEIFSELLKKELEKERIKYALIYGSFAKGTEQEGSDIDLLVVGGVSESYLLKTIPKIESSTGREINFILWKEKEFEEKAARKTPLIREILETPVIMIVGDEDGFKRAAKEGSD